MTELPVLVVESPLETIAYVAFVVLALGTLLLKNWAIRRWPANAGDGSETDGGARSDGDSERNR